MSREILACNRPRSWTEITFGSNIFGTSGDCNNCNGIPCSHEKFVGALAKWHFEIVQNLRTKLNRLFGHGTQGILHSSERAVRVAGQIPKKLEEVSEKSRTLILTLLWGPIFTTSI
jgi:hypothetical protein